VTSSGLCVDSTAQSPGYILDADYPEWIPSTLIPNNRRFRFLGNE